MFKKIESKIVFATVLCCILVTVIQSVFLFSKFDETLNQNMNDIIYSTMNENRNLIEQKIIKAKTLANNISDVVVGMVNLETFREDAPKYDEMLNPIVKNIISDNIDDIMGAYLILDPEKTDDTYGAYYEDIELNGNIQKLDMYPHDIFYPDNPRLSWYYECIDLKDGKWYEPYLTSRGIAMVSYTVPIYKDGVYVALLSIDLNFEEFRDYVNSIELTNSGYLFVLNEKLDFIIHKEFSFEENLAEYDTGKYSYIADSIKNSNTEILDFEVNGVQNLLTHKPLSNGWILCTVIGKEMVLNANKELFNLVIKAFIVCLVISLLASKIFGMTISRGTSYVSKTINTLAKLDLRKNNIDVAYEKKRFRKDEIGTLITSSINLRKHLIKIIPKVIDNSKNTFEYINNFENSMNKSSVTMNDTLSTVDVLYESAENQIKNANVSNEQLSILANMIEKAIKFSSTMKISVDSTQSANETSIIQMKDLSERFELNKISSIEGLKLFKILYEKTMEIKNFVSVIDDITSQTNILAINASIEAARVGQEGQGFAVVAQNISQLSRETGTATTQIQNMVEDIFQNLKLMDKSMETGNTAMKSASEALESSQKTFNSISKDINSMALISKELISVIEEISSNKEETITAIESILKVSSESAKDIQKIHKLLQNETYNINVLAQSGTQLKEMSKALNDIVDQFTI